MTESKKKATRKRKPRINEEQLEMARLYEKLDAQIEKRMGEDSKVVG